MPILTKVCTRRSVLCFRSTLVVLYSHGSTSSSVWKTSTLIPWRYVCLSIPSMYVVGRISGQSHRSNGWFSVAVKIECRVASAWPQSCLRSTHCAGVRCARGTTVTLSFRHVSHSSALVSIKQFTVKNDDMMVGIISFSAFRPLFLSSRKKNT